ncbi:peptidoglycan recognition family protein [Actinoplanes sp. NPDC051346]|uniref:peptidoglycan recognition protein family protein n=1 Tax=Actinoplanes sp. NPDC051346 TaxID=3155048 RepID=UPI0034437E9E
MISRRSLLRGATGLAVAAPLSVAASRPAAAAGASVPTTLSSIRGVVPSGVAIAPELALTHLSVTAGGSVRLRTRAGWQPWREASGCPGGRDGVAAQPRMLIPAAGALDYEVRGEGVSVVEINTVDGPTRTVAARQTRLPMAVPTQMCPQYLSREAWGADESYRFNDDGTPKLTLGFFKVQTLTVHHSGEDVPVTDPIAHVRGIYYNQAMTQDFGDIGYQLLIDADGRVYEGAYSDPDKTPVFGPAPGSDGLPLAVNGAHVGGFNGGNVGICLLGNFMQAPPTAAALRSLKVMLARLAVTTKLDPLATTEYVNPISGKKATLATIPTHQDWHRANPDAGATLCPGDKLYALMPGIRKDVAALTKKLPAIPVR